MPERGKPINEEDNLGQIFMAWIKDTHENPTRENFLRLQEVMEKGCNDKQFVMRSMRLGVNGALTIARLLDRTPIEKIDLYENVIRDHGVQAISQLVRDSRSLTYLNVGSNDIGPMGCIYIAALLPVTKKLRTLVLGSEEGDLHSNKIDSEAGKAVAEGLSKNKSIRWLDLNRNPLGRDSQEVFAAFTRVVERNRTLGTLKLGSTHMHSSSAVGLVRALYNNQAIEFLDLHDNDLQPQVGEALGELILSKSQRGGSTLQTLLLHDNTRLRAKGLVPMFRALKGDSVLSTLNLARTNMADEGAIALAESLSTNNTITFLDLCYNEITEEGCIQLCGALQQNMGLQFLGLSGNKIKDDGACALATTLECNNTINHLELASSRLSDRGAVALGVALALNPSLVTLKMANNHVSDDAGQAFAELVEKNSKLLCIDVRGNQVSHSTLLRIKKVVKKNKAFRDGEMPNQLQQEVIRLHFQQYKLQEANGELKEHQKARLELQEQADKTERDARNEKENTAKRSKEIIEKILLVENFCEELRAKRKQKDEESGKAQQQYEQDIKALQERLKQDTKVREERQIEADEVDAQFQRLQKDREERMIDLKERISAAKRDREAWMQKNKDYRLQAQQTQEQIGEFEREVRERQQKQTEEREAEMERRARKRPKPSKAVQRIRGDEIIDSLLSSQ